jgi:succinoglycan biosynthesis protein ExoV
MTVRQLRLYGWQENFGDALNHWLWPRLFPGHTDGDDALLLGIGTVLSEKVPSHPVRKFVLGAGVGNGRLPEVSDEWTFLAVRGPRTAARLGLPPEVAITDSALLLRSQLGAISDRRHAVSFMPHIISAYSEHWAPIARDVGFHYIDPRGPIEDVLRDIRESELLITEAMHGAIVADAFRVPWIRVQSGEFHAPTSKWLDWTESLGIDHESHRLPFFWKREAGRWTSIKVALRTTEAKMRLQWIKRMARPRLSADARSDDAYERLMAKVDVLSRWLVGR